MILYLMRHGKAMSAVQDPERRLTPEGAAQIQRIGRALPRLGVRPDLVVSSTKARARQTAELATATGGYPAADILTTDLLKPNTPPEQTLDFLAGHPDRGSILAAGHLPNLAEVARTLLGARSGTVSFEAGAVCCLEVERLPASTAILRWMLTPGQLVMLA